MTLGEKLSIHTTVHSIPRGTSACNSNVGENDAHVRFVQEYYQFGRIRCPPTVSIPELRDACDYLLIPFSADTVRCQNLRALLHELSNEGARQQFTQFLEVRTMPPALVRD